MVGGGATNKLTKEEESSFDDELHSKLPHVKRTWIDKCIAMYLWTCQREAKEASQSVRQSHGWVDDGFMEML